ncbi:MAG: hypothetical protein BGP23_14165 [Lysobacterales bacterium 66-474]|nr:MAG: hypothetical protein ABT18_09850 [Rhodanobacter sp. SCN 66-43]OJY83774.1 MAG: hypothetical protein BGP23_14165 [Xanthomonadales bacterium 66-474]
MASSTDLLESATQAAVRLRDEFIARGWPTSADVGRANGVSPNDNPAKWANDRREAGELMGAWSPKERTYRHPDFQFDRHGHLKPGIKELLAALAEHADFAANVDKSGWRRVFWMYGATYELAAPDGTPRSAAELFATHPDDVIAYARKSAVPDIGDAW